MSWTWVSEILAGCSTTMILGSNIAPRSFSLLIFPLPVCGDAPSTCCHGTLLTPPSSFPPERGSDLRKHLCPAQLVEDVGAHGCVLKTGAPAGRFLDHRFAFDLFPILMTQMRPSKSYFGRRRAVTIRTMILGFFLLVWFVLELCICGNFTLMRLPSVHHIFSSPWHTESQLSN